MLAFCGSFALALLAFDALAYFLLPDEFASFAPQYRRPGTLRAAPVQPEIGRGYPRYYFRQDGEMGFDIAPMARALIRMEGYEYDVFSNDLGCFDRNGLRDFQKSPEYVYLAGDSFAWGYSRYEAMFGTIWQARTGRLTAKCGVPHSGQRHQLAKFNRIVSRIGKPPRLVLVAYFPNDPADDLFYPYTTVIRGYQVDTAYWRNEEVFRPTREALEGAVDAVVDRRRARDNSRSPVRQTLRTYSLSATLLSGVLSRASRNTWSLLESRPSNVFGRPLAETVPMHVVKSSYLDDPRTLNNRQAIRDWGEDAAQKGYRLVFLLIPPQSNATDTQFFQALKQWLTRCGIEYLDFTAHFAEGGIASRDLYWKRNGHLNEQGNAVVGDALVRRPY